MTEFCPRQLQVVLWRVVIGSFVNVCEVYWYFFFQAEGGIRDVAVTGVQTCALPILVRARRARVRAGNADGKDECAPANSEVAPGGYPAGSLHGRHSKSRLAETSGGMVERSEGGREGKEGRFRGSPDH